MTNSPLPSVLFLNPWERLVGPNRYLAEMLRYAPELAQKATVILHEPDDAQEEYRYLGCHVVIWEEIAQIRGGMNRSNLCSFARNHSLGLGRVLRRLGDMSHDLIVSNTEHLLLGDLAARFLGIPHIKIFHTITFVYRLQGRPNAIRAYLRTLTCGSNLIIAVSETQKHALILGGLAAKEVVTVPNPIPVRELSLDSLQPLPDSLRGRLEIAGPVLVNIGRISPLKGHDLFIEALPAIIRPYPNLLCILVGRLGPDTGVENTKDFLKALQWRIQELGLTHNVLLIGEVDYLPSLLRRADVYVHTSRMESFCRAVAEALICGTPVVAFDSGAVPEVAGPGAILVRTGDTAALAKAIIDLLVHKEKRESLAQQGREYIEKSFAALQVAGRFTEVLSQQFLC